MTLKINILGTWYTIMMDVDSADLPELADGCMDHSTKVIKIAKLERDKNSVEDLDVYRKKVIRHEIIHAFLYESGNWNCSGRAEAWGISEEITDWIAIQFPKILQAFKDADAL